FRRVEQSFLWAFLAIRSVHLAQGILDVAAGYHSYADPAVAAGVLAACLLDCLFILVRCLPRRRVDAFAVGVDLIVGVVGLLVIAAGLHDHDRTTSINWMLPYTVGAVLPLAIVYRRSVGIAFTMILAGAYLGSVSADLRLGSGPATTAIVNTASYLGFYVVAALIIGLIRSLVSRLHQAQVEAVATSQRLSVARERSRQHRLLHDHALQSLESIAKGWAGGPGGAALLAGQEATRLRRVLEGDLAADEGRDSRLSGLRDALGDLANAYQGVGLRVELVVAELTTEPYGEGLDALVGAARESLNNVAKHAGVGSAVVQASSSDADVEVTVRDHGCGFELAEEHRGFGLKNSVIACMRDAGGSAEISSRPGRGTKVTLRVPL
ncbi:MAG: ATP-binding protein, partial [Actinomycetota bacterium]|nr:ATP-binding protein [Actinomycetota bacterium]